MMSVLLIFDAPAKSENGGDVRSHAFAQTLSSKCKESTTVERLAENCLLIHLKSFGVSAFADLCHEADAHKIPYLAHFFAESPNWIRSSR